jgi:hypothetical protein
MEIKDWINIAYIIILIIVFIIQYYQIKKQNSLLSYYDKIFNIIKIDEIEKYVKLKEDNVKLELDYKNKTLSSLMENAEVMNKNAGKSVQNAGVFLKDAGILLEGLKNVTQHNDIILEIIELTKVELSESYEIITRELEKNGNEDLKKSINELLSNKIRPETSGSPYREAISVKNPFNPFNPSNPCSIPQTKKCHAEPAEVKKLKEQKKTIPVHKPSIRKPSPKTTRLSDSDTRLSDSGTRLSDSDTRLSDSDTRLSDSDARLSSPFVIPTRDYR